MKKATSYLQRLRYDPRLEETLIARYLKNPRLALLILFIILTIGILSYISLPRNLNPEIKIPIILVNTILPGASPKDVESLITIPIEESVSGLDGIKKITSDSRDSVSLVTLEFESGTDPDKARDDVQAAIDTVNLPEDAQDPKAIKLDFENQPVWTFALEANKDLASLNRISEDLKQKIEELESVDKVMITGLLEQEIQINIKPEAISNYSINPILLSGAIKAALRSFPAGGVKTSKNTLSLSLEPQIKDLDTLRNLEIQLGQEPVKLLTIADVSLKAKPSQASSFLISPSEDIKWVVNFNVFRNTGFNINQTVEDASLVIKEKVKETKGVISLNSILNTSELIDEQFRELTRDFLITIILVFVSLFVFLGTRQAVIASLAIPITFFISFTFMNAAGISLSFVSLFSLLLSLGLLVDDTIVIISAMTAYYRSKKFTPLQTGLLVWRDFSIPVFTTTITTVWAFLPLLLSAGIIGEFIKPIPIVVSTTLMGSLFTAFMFTMPFIILLLSGGFPKRVIISLYITSLLVLVTLFYLLFSGNTLFLLEIFFFLVLLTIFFVIRKYLWMKFKKSAQRLVPVFEHGLIHFDVISLRYQRLIYRILVSRGGRIKTIAAVLIFSLVSLLLLPLGLVKNEFFPKSDQDFIYMTVKLPSGTNIEKTNIEAAKILEEIKTTPELEFATANIGQGFNPGMGILESETNNILFSLKLKDKSARKQTSIEVGEFLRDKFKSYQKGELLIVESTGGPPAGADLQIKLFGDDLSTLDKLADQIQANLEPKNGVTGVDKSIKPGISKLTFKPDQDKLLQNGVGIETIGFWLRTFSSGMDVDTVKLEGETEDKDINLRLTADSASIQSLGEINLPTPQGSVPILSLGKLLLEPNPTQITREDGKRTISVTASVRPGFSISDLNKDLESYAKSIKLPRGYSWATGGLNEENQKSVNSILQAMLYSFLLIITTMVVQFSSFRKALIVMLVIPLSVAGVFVMFGLTQTPLSFPALVGVLALFGIVVKNSILVVDKIDQNLKSGLAFENAIAEGSASRLEPIALTSMTAILGLVPISLSDPLWRGLGGAIISGLTFSGTIMLFFIPVVYYYFMKTPNCQRLIKLVECIRDKKHG